MHEKQFRHISDVRLPIHSGPIGTFVSIKVVRGEGDATTEQLEFRVERRKIQVPKLLGPAMRENSDANHAKEE